ncbi:MAG: hypothetical protein MUE41_10315 [Gemmatimonadaceae bacterium]|nr:hypothetical protein [Gemmatimonadaceae bacterium]
MRVVAQLLVCLALVPPLAAQQSWRQHVDPRRVAARSDSFTVLLRGAVGGFDRLTVARDGAQWVLSDEVQLDRMGGQRSTIRFSEALVEHALRQEGKFGTVDMRIALDRASGRMSGTALTPTGGPAPVAIDAAAGDDVIDDNAVVQVLPFIAWREGLSVVIPVLKSGKGTVSDQVVTVTGRGATTVPAGTFDTWKLGVSDGGRTWLVADVTTTAPYRVVRMSPGGGGMDMQLVK